MTEYALGIDIGSTAVKAVLYNGRRASGWVLVPTGWSPRDTGEAVIDKLLRRRRLAREDLRALVATGYGRALVEGATRRVTEITCHARGAHYLAPDARTVLDIGGQDSKVIVMDDGGNVLDFAMNDKCAAGTGRFFQMMSARLDYDVAEFGSVSADGDVQALSSMCAVFAETEVVSWLAKGASRESLVRGLMTSIARRSAAMMSRAGMKEPLFFSGGLSRSPSLVTFLERELNCSVAVHERSQFAGALGAAIIGWEARKR
ncbi:MAG: acyl-CoA dehydratase activase [Pyramidobacter sp.]|nr:acyl-CoA dehydratase activase [Pyramidobacter sp.]